MTSIILDCLCTVSFNVVTCILSHSLRGAFTSFPLHNQECFTIVMYSSLILGYYDSCCLHTSISLFFSHYKFFRQLRRLKESTPHTKKRQNWKNYIYIHCMYLSDLCLVLHFSLFFLSSLFWSVSISSIYNLHFKPVHPLYILCSYHNFLQRTVSPNFSIAANSSPKTFFKLQTSQSLMQCLIQSRHLRFHLRRS